METQITLRIDDHTAQLLAMACAEVANTTPDHFLSAHYRLLSKQLKQNLKTFYKAVEAELLKKYEHVQIEKPAREEQAVHG